MVSGQLEGLDQNVCLENVDSIIVKNIYVHNTTTIEDVPNYDFHKSYDDILDQGINVAASSFYENYAHDNIDNHFIHRVAANIPQFDVDHETQDCVFDDDGDIFDTVYHEDASSEKESESGHSSENDENNGADMSLYESNIAWEEEINDESVCFHRSEGMYSSSMSTSEGAFWFLHYTNQLDGECLESGLPSNCEDKEMVNQCFPFEAECENQNERLLNINKMEDEITTYSDGFEDESWYLHIDFPKQNNESNVDMNIICFLDEIEYESSCDSNFASHIESLHDSGMGSEFKVFNNAFYDEDYDSDQPTSCHNVYS